MTKKDYSIKQLLLEDAEPRPKLGEKPARNCNITTKTAREIAMAALTQGVCVEGARVVICNTDPCDTEDEADETREVDCGKELGVHSLLRVTVKITVC